MIKLLTGYTHLLVRTTLKQDAISTQVFAYVDICFGPGDDSAIANIPWRRLEGRTMAFTSPRCAIIEDNNKVGRPVFKGQLAQEICELCARGVDTIKKQFGNLKTGRIYRVDLRGAADVTNEYQPKKG